MTKLRVLRRARTLIVTAVVGICAATTLAAPDATTAAPQPGSAASSPFRLVATHAYPSYSTGAYERQVQYWVNRQRSAHGLRTLRLHRCTDGVAERWGRYLAENDQFYHQSMTAILRKCHAKYAGETLGKGQITPRRLVVLWMHSPTHRDILMSKAPNRIGIGSYPDAHGQWVTAANFMRF